MFLFNRNKHFTLVVTLGLIPVFGSMACTVKSQQSAVVSQAVSASAGLAEPSPSRQRGLPDVIPGNSTVVPGRGIGLLRLKGTREQAIELLGTPNEEYTFNEGSLGPCRYTELHWNDPKHDDRWGVFVYLQEDRIYQIMVDTPRYATVGSITSDSSPEEVRRLFSNLTAYALLGSNSKINGGEDLIYWVDPAAGIAFEFYHHAKFNERRLARMMVFESGTEFLPAGCISPPQQWQKLKPFSLSSLK